MYQPIVQLKSGGYLVINPTEALVSIDINSGRSTREHNIEQTATNTNLEAAQEIARQLRLRDMAGLIVIDFIDMEQNSHVRKVEKAMKEALKNDRARIQVGRISSFGLMEMSRQRLRTGVLEASTKPCAHCEGTGLMRTAASAGLSALRIIEDEAARGRGERIQLRAGREAAIYVLNKKRSELADIERRYGVSIEIVIDESFEGARMAVDSSGPRPVAAPRPQVVSIEEDDSDFEDEVAEDEADEDETEAEESREGDGEGDRQGRKRRRRRRGGRGRSRREGQEQDGQAEPAQSSGGADEADDPAQSEPAGERETEEAAGDGRRRRRRRGRGGARPEGGEAMVEADSSPMIDTPVEDEAPIAETAAVEEAKPAPKRSRRKKAVEEAEVAVVEPAPAEAQPAETAEEASAPAKPARKRRTKKTEAEADSATPLETAEAAPIPAANNDTAEEATGEPRRGWWQKTFG